MRVELRRAIAIHTSDRGDGGQAPERQRVRPRVVQQVLERHGGRGGQRRPERQRHRVRAHQRAGRGCEPRADQDRQRALRDRDGDAGEQARREEGRRGAGATQRGGADGHAAHATRIRSSATRRASRGVTGANAPKQTTGNVVSSPATVADNPRSCADIGQQRRQRRDQRPQVQREQDDGRGDQPAAEPRAWRRCQLRCICIQFHFMHTQDMPLAEARALIARAIDKAQDIGVRGAVVVVGGSGVLISASRMDRGGTGGMARARSKAWIAATQQMPSVVHLGRMRTLPSPMVTGFVACSPEAIFPGAGGMPIAGDDGSVVAGIAASGATVGPFVDYAGADRRKLIADGKPANCEDLLVHWALGIPYEGQHGDDEERWIAAYGALPDEPGLGYAEPPPASQPEHEWALGLTDRAIAEAESRGVRIAVAVVDHRGDPIQQDTMDGAPTAGAVRGGGGRRRRSDLPASERRGRPRADLRPPYRVATVAGGLPCARDTSSPDSASAAQRRTSATRSPRRCSREGLRRRRRRDRRPLRGTPRAARRRRGLGLRRVGRARRRDQPRRPAAHRPRRADRAGPGSHRCRRDPALRARDRCHQGDVHGGGDDRPPRASSRTAPSAACRTGSAARRSSPATRRA